MFLKDIQSGLKQKGLVNKAEDISDTVKTNQPKKLRKINSQSKINSI